MNELQRIIARTRIEVDQRCARTPLRELGVAAAKRIEHDPIRGFTAALAAPGVSVIAEHKRRSPSAGAIREDLELEDVVTAYERGGGGGGGGVWGGGGGGGRPPRRGPARC
jgi:indole-3-glycerol phosphate synthase